MHAIDIVLIVAVVALLIFALHRAIGTWTGQRDCCSGSKKTAMKRFPKVKVADTDESHYPYAADYQISGMKCANCADNVTRALDSVGRTWATVDLKRGVAHVRSKEPIDENSYSSAVKMAGYRLIS